jgi:hypothetical protein
LEEINNEANMKKENKFMTPNPGPGKLKNNNYNTPMIGGNFKSDPYGMIAGGGKQGSQKNMMSGGPASGNKRF